MTPRRSHEEAQSSLTRDTGACREALRRKRRRCRDLIERVDATKESTERDDRTTRRRQPRRAPNGIGVSACAILQLVSGGVERPGNAGDGKVHGGRGEGPRGSPLLAGQVRGALSHTPAPKGREPGLDGKCASGSRSIHSSCDVDTAVIIDRQLAKIDVREAVRGRRSMSAVAATPTRSGARGS